MSAGFGEVEKRVRTSGGGASGTVRNLRIREDTAKYLLNLDPASAHYDPKSRSMREDPNPEKVGPRCCSKPSAMCAGPACGELVGAVLARRVSAQLPPTPRTAFSFFLEAISRVRRRGEMP